MLALTLRRAGFDPDVGPSDPRGGKIESVMEVNALDLGRGEGEKL